MARYNKLPSDERLKELVQLGDTVKQMSLRFGVATSIVRKRLLALGLDLGKQDEKRSHGKAALTKERLSRLRKDHTAYAIALMYGVSARTVTQLAKEYGLPPVPRRSGSKLLLGGHDERAGYTEGR